MIVIVLITVAILSALISVEGNSATISTVPLSKQVIAPHQLVVVQPGGSEILSLQYLEGKISDLEFFLVNATGTGKLYQLSQNYVKMGYEPKNGQKIDLGSMVSGEKKLPSSSVAIDSASKVAITEPKQRFFYTRPSPDRFPTNRNYATIDYVIARKSDGYQSSTGTITIVPPTGALVGSDFSFVAASKVATTAAVDGWTIVGNRHVFSSVNGDVTAQPPESPSFERFRLGDLHNHYIVGKEDSINIEQAGGSDQQLWYFQAPDKFLGNQAVAYRGHLSFNTVAVSGDFSQMNDLNSLNLIELECATCDGPVRRGLKLVYRVAQWPHPFTGTAQQVRVHLHENGGWLKDSQDMLTPWSTPTQCDMLQVLGRLSALRILGDFTQGFETIALDDIRISNSKSKSACLPVVVVLTLTIHLIARCLFDSANSRLCFLPA